MTNSILKRLTYKETDVFKDGIGVKGLLENVIKGGVKKSGYQKCVCVCDCFTLFPCVLHCFLVFHTVFNLFRIEFVANHVLSVALNLS